MGTAVHDARTRAGLTQARLAELAGVSRKWLIGLEQGTRTRAELIKIFDVLRALDLTIRLYPAKEEPGTESQALSDTLAIQSSEQKLSSTLSTRQAETAVQAMRQYDMPSRATLEAMRKAVTLPDAALEAMRKASILPDATLEAMRKASILPDATLEAMRKASILPDAALEAMRKAVTLPDATLEAMRKAAQTSIENLESLRGQKDEEE